MPPGKTPPSSYHQPHQSAGNYLFPPGSIFFENLFPQQKVVGGGGRDETMRSLLPLKPKENFS